MSKVEVLKKSFKYSPNGIKVESYKKGDQLEIKDENTVNNLIEEKVVKRVNTIPKPKAAGAAPQNKAAAPPENKKKEDYSQKRNNR